MMARAIPGGTFTLPATSIALNLGYGAMPLGGTENIERPHRRHGNNQDMTCTPLYRALAGILNYYAGSCFRMCCHVTKPLQPRRIHT
jgi:hypothetical protein